MIDAVRSVYSVIDEHGTLMHRATSLGHGEQSIAQDFGISWAELSGFETKRRNSRALSAFLSGEGKFREIVGARDSDG